MESFEKIKEIRNKTSLSQVKFSEKYGIPVRTLEDWERGKSTPPSYVLNLLEFRVNFDLSKNNF